MTRRWIAERPEAHAGQAVGNGHCVAFVRQAAGLPHTSQWRRGPSARHGALTPGTAIATFDQSGRYENHTGGRSHAAVLIKVTAPGLMVWDQWVGTPVHRRTIRFRGGAGQPVNDGDAFFAIETDEPPPEAA